MTAKSHQIWRDRTESRSNGRFCTAAYPPRPMPRIRCRPKTCDERLERRVVSIVRGRLQHNFDQVNQFRGRFMDTVGVFEAKTHISEITDRVARGGAEKMVTRNARPVASDECDQRCAAAVQGTGDRSAVHAGATAQGHGQGVVAREPMFPVAGAKVATL